MADLSIGTLVIAAGVSLVASGGFFRDAVYFGSAALLCFVAVLVYGIWREVRRMNGKVDSR